MGNNIDVSCKWANNNASKNGRYSYTEALGLGEGGFGCVLKANDELRRHDVTVKIITAKNSLRRDERELLRNLRHENIVAIRDYFECKKSQDITIGIVMEYCPTDLHRYLQNRFKPDFVQRLTEDKSLQWCTQLALALKYIHNRGIVHSHLKPSNILVTSTDNLKVADVGLAKIFHKKLHGDIPYMQTVAGTPPYMAPELWKNHYDESADVFSVGLVMFTLCEVPTNLMPLVNDQCFLAKYYNSYASSRKQEAMSLLQPKKCSQYENELFNAMLQYNSKDRPTAFGVAQQLRMAKRSIHRVEGQGIKWQQTKLSWNQCDTTFLRNLCVSFIFVMLVICVIYYSFYSLNWCILGYV